MREPASAELVVKQTLDRYGRIDALINVAGAVPPTDLFAMTDAGWNDGLSLSPRGVAEGVQANSALPGPVMTDRRRSTLTGYAASRGLSLAEEMRRFAAKARHGRYGQVADLIALLVSPAARWMRGTAVRMDGSEAKAI